MLQHAIDHLMHKLCQKNLEEMKIETKTPLRMDLKLYVIVAWWFPSFYTLYYVWFVCREKKRCYWNLHSVFYEIVPNFKVL